MTRRYYVPDLRTQAPVVQLPDEEASHAARVMRVQPGDRIELFDGTGHQSGAEVVSVSKRECVVRCDAIETVNREPLVAVDLAIGFPKPDRAKEMVERLAELGVARVFPVVFERTQRPPADNLLSKLRRIVIEACKQSGRNALMEIESPIEFESLAKRISGGQASRETEPTGQSPVVSWQRVLVAMPNSPPLIAMEDSWQALKASEADQSNFDGRPRTLVLIGPEGGVSEAEQQRCNELGVESVGLGSRILRIETAASVVAARLVVD
ncbi:Ribosomal RNA small subunit methyltransferase E [Rhodopirellula islandica]|uniref:Ribosomal RNA small subunit methyltransferase E n=1 Tax=Rhodopirellula islandica TaxID=595434 RepID=A0A0J1B6Z8_RHOIS|nr:RsmE family RNA methyltransferase [Rhodopirellula islandica]KLU02512.1 Ribosomal RNA small subunit methyltransferase E [Rhodopirellula islandica]